MRVWAPGSTSARRMGAGAGVAPPAFRGKAETCGAASSMVFQLPQPGHRPSQPGDTYPHSRQTKELLPRGNRGPISNEGPCDIYALILEVVKREVLGLEGKKAE